jgi:N-acetylneuraminic acid mutarotase
VDIAFPREARSLGGFDRTFHFVSPIEGYDPSTNTWAVKSSMPFQLARFAVASIDDSLYVLGGEDLGGPTPAMVAYMPATNTWSDVAPMPMPRSALAAAAINGVIYTVGNMDETNSPSGRLKGGETLAYMP